jgi:HEAT repeat protein
MIDLSPSRDSAELINAIYEARRQNRRDLRPQLEQLLKHEEPMVREEALSLLATKWGIKSLHPQARHLLQHDEDFGVRARAAIAMASLSSPETRQGDAHLLAGVFNNQDVRPEVKLACFEALTLMAGRPRVVELDDTSARAVQQLLEEIAQHRS